MALKLEPKNKKGSEKETKFGPEIRANSTPDQLKYKTNQSPSRKTQPILEQETVPLV